MNPSSHWQKWTLSGLVLHRAAGRTAPWLCLPPPARAPQREPLSAPSLLSPLLPFPLPTCTFWRKEYFISPFKNIFSMLSYIVWNQTYYLVSPVCLSFSLKHKLQGGTWSALFPVVTPVVRCLVKSLWVNKGVKPEMLVLGEEKEKVAFRERQLCARHMLSTPPGPFLSILWDLHTCQVDAVNPLSLWK